MRNNNKNELLVPTVKELVNSKFEDLGDFIGDLLLILEIQVAEQQEPSVRMRITRLIDKYAQNADKMLNKHRIILMKEIEELVSLVRIDLEQLSENEQESSQEKPEFTNL